MRTLNHNFVRPAQPEHAQFIAGLQVQAMAEVLNAELGPDAPVDQLDQEAIAAAWSQTIAQPERARHGVFVATASDQPEGYVAFGDGAERSPLAEDGVAVEILGLEVVPDQRRQGHGSRMLAAAADLVRDEGGDYLQVWLAPAEEEKIRFFQSAGFAPAGLRRTLDVMGRPLTQHLWFATLDRENPAPTS
ncbi:GNAT family N-acetyltransferase [Scrofimicrobium sp. R131]|uniref:GNAT family N-acetyltransferase n=1 Tax=Scrofimicrobium appendicitidis TaxID=3079930 RepID=A0AAU7V514_9ACTO